MFVYTAVLHFMNTLNHIGIMFLICQALRMWNFRYIEFLSRH